VFAEKKHSKYRHVYAVARIEFPVNLKEPEKSFSVLKVFTSQEAAEQDAERLNTVNADKDCAYHTYLARMVMIQ